MAKGDDAIQRKRNKANRKKLQRKEGSSSNVSARVAALIAAKKRRKSGKRLKCQGMCFSLPTLDDPFNDRHGKTDFVSKEMNKLGNSRADKADHGKRTKSREGSFGRKNNEANCIRDKLKTAKLPENKPTRALDSGRNLVKPCVSEKKAIEKTDCQGQQGHVRENSDSSRFLALCLKTIENTLWHENTQNGDMVNPLFVNAWGVEFWNLYASGKDIVETSAVRSSAEQIAWIVSVAADSFARKEKEGLCSTSPFLLYLVPSSNKAIMVRAICKPLKALGIHTVSIHSSASIDHQIHGLTSCEPEFLVSTPERLLELIALKAIDISQTSLLVVDGISAFSEGGYLDMVKSVRLSISGTPHTVVFNDSFDSLCIVTIQNLMQGTIERLSLSDSIASLSSCIIQSIYVCTSEEEKLSKGFQILDRACGDQPTKVLYAVGEDNELLKLAGELETKGYLNSSCTGHEMSESKKGKGRPEVSIMSIEHLATADIGDYEVVMLPSFVPSIDIYISIVTRMARNTVHGTLHSFLTEENLQLAGPLVETLEQCHQVVPETLRDLAFRSSQMEE